MHNFTHILIGNGRIDAVGLVLPATVTILSACNTTAGVGEDVSATGPRLDEQRGEGQTRNVIARRVAERA